MEANKERRQSIEEDMNKLVGRDVTRRIESIAVATDEEAVAMSTLLNEAMGETLRDIDPVARSFFKLFKKMVSTK